MYIDDRITLEELQTKSSEFSSQRAILEEELENDPALKRKKREAEMKKILRTGDILGMDYERQKTIVRSLINKVRVTVDKIVIKWKI